MFNKIRLAYLEDMINDPEVQEAIKPYDLVNGFIHTKNSLKDTTWTKEWANKNNIGPGDVCHFYKMSKYWWEVDFETVYMNMAGADPRSLVPTLDWDVYYHPGLELAVVINAFEIEPEFLNKLLNAAAKDPGRKGHMLKRKFNETF